MSRRLAATLALFFAAAAVVMGVVVAAGDFPAGLPVVICLLAAVVMALNAVVRRGAARTSGLAVAALLIVASAVLILVNGRILEDAIAIALGVLAIGFARIAFREQADLPSAPRPRRPYLFFNPRSGGGKSARFKVADEARSRGVEPVELKPGDDLEALVNEAIDAGADALAMAGGDGSQAVVARLAADHGLPYACIPAGTRNHFALDLGVDRDDVVGALDAFVDGRERRVDLAEVNGRVFVNNVSLGLYADAVQRPGYREAKLRTIIGTMPDAFGPNGGDGLDLRWAGPEGAEEHGSSVILVSNNHYRLGKALGSGTRPRLGDGLLGIAVFDSPAGVPHARRPWRDWTARTFEVRANHRVHAGIDGEAVVLTSPLEFTMRPKALRVRIARSHPGASPSAAVPETAWGTLRALTRIAFDARPAAAAKP